MISIIVIVSMRALRFIAAIVTLMIHVPIFMTKSCSLTILVAIATDGTGMSGVALCCTSRGGYYGFIGMLVHIRLTNPLAILVGISLCTLASS